MDSGAASAGVWPKDPKSAHPYRLLRIIQSASKDSSLCRGLAFFPWSRHDIQRFWGTPKSAADVFEWHQVVDEFQDALAVGDTRTGSLHIFFIQRMRQPITLRFPHYKDFDNMTILDADAFCVAWALQKTKPWHPLLVCSHRNLLYIFDVKTQKCVGCLRGHGGEITSITVRPDQPHIFCSTSRDFTARIYDLTLRPQQEPANVHWPPYKDPNKAGPAFGLHMTDNEGPSNGIGRCIAVTGAQRSGGHRAAVLHAAWHPDLPVLATCGIDRCAKLWYTPPCKDGTKIRRLDQPIFSTSMLHTGRVMSIAWLGRDVLLTHGGPALFRLEVDGENEQESTHTQTQTQTQTSTQADDQMQEDTKEIEYEYDTASGDFKLWQWLSIDRFFPPVYFRHEPPERMVVPLADYKESASFRILATRAFVDGPEHVWQGHRVHVYPLHDPAPPKLPNSPSHSAWLAFHLLPGAPSVQFFNPAHMDVFEVEPLEWVREDAEVAELAAKRLRIGDEMGEGVREGTNAGPSGSAGLSGSARTGGSGMGGGGVGGNGDGGVGGSVNGAASAGEEIPDSQPNPPPTWEVKLQANGVGEEKAAACAMGMDGQALAVVSDLGSVWIWRRKVR